MNALLERACLKALQMMYTNTSLSLSLSEPVMQRHHDLTSASYPYISDPYVRFWRVVSELFRTFCPSIRHAATVLQDLITVGYHFNLLSCYRPAGGGGRGHARNLLKGKRTWLSGGGESGGVRSLQPVSLCFSPSSSFFSVPFHFLSFLFLAVSISVFIPLPLPPSSLPPLTLSISLSGVFILTFRHLLLVPL